MAASNSTKISWRLQEFEAHSSSVSCLSLGKSSGRLLATGGEDCRVNIWAVSKANCIMLWDVRRKGYVFRYKGHTQAVRSLAFSPDGKWLASASDDCTIKLWDLTQGKTITEFKSHTAAVNIVQFHPNEYLLASGSSDRCVFFSADGSCLYSGATDTLRCSAGSRTAASTWCRVSDLAVCNQQLIGVSHHLSSVSSFVVDLKRVKKSGGAALQGVIQDNQPIPEHKDPKAAALRRNYERPSTACSASQRVKQRSEAERQSPEGERRSQSDDEADEKLSSAEIHNAEDFKEIFQPKCAICRHSVSGRRQLKDLVSPFPEKMQAAPLASSTPVQRVEPTVVSCSPPSLSASLNTGKSKPPPKIILSNRNEPIGLNVADFLPVRGGGLSDDEALSQLKKGHDTMCVMLRSRHRNLETVRGVWARQDIKSALDAAVSMNDLSIVVSMEAGSLHDGLPQIEQLLQSKYESYIQTGCSSLKMIMKHFWKLISETLRATPSVGVDITREERRQKCRLCCRQLQNLSNMVKTRAVGGGEITENRASKSRRRRVPHAVIFSRPAEETRPSDSSLTHIVF
ncbi:hypothetical protein F7725_025741 [Dissostichus mawsoni]|uniref:Katanin p80 subunit C-terminal domain-containing protein n=1 Tax=Dissostichus mawsoni TaxID=36200 RepID=A0A7J5X543_DISMA|nr:hypothetical protein F7725_025741 [Dissostichus mawsoni]